ncbi:arsenate reductase (glutaredoxin) [Paracoccus sp. SCSIO 75233]|uniref:arsenate reductase (glutaredoxin) n=1 Tax=Paracoccus sp. SCSIO 75233 TaxID=3017782 RepID=UPI0022F0839C|nr:arsenate reductase (glutaredoxin) [Paracoccus sp. SCSIO 75233]WBU51810.1 arsenate reductase (glutaredoxin) [Paracoccus sp. SCSIO 75233]
MTIPDIGETRQCFQTRNRMSDEMTVKIYHNPKCVTSRKVLAAIRDKGVEPEVIEYLKTPPSRADLIALAEASGLGVRGLLRRRNTPYDELGLGNTDLSDDALLDAMAAHPVLLERPIVVTEKGVRLVRPVEKLEEIL